jgi:hypothetical protein
MAHVAELTSCIVAMLNIHPLVTLGKDGSAANWPGFGGRPPLRIPSNKFYFVFVSDGKFSSACN